jgi:hypothetical protein
MLGHGRVNITVRHESPMIEDLTNVCCRYLYLLVLTRSPSASWQQVLVLLSVSTATQCCLL